MKNKNDFRDAYDLFREFERNQTRGKLFEALLRIQYLISVKQDMSELPPLFSTRSLTNDLAFELGSKKFEKLRSSPPVKMRMRRYDGRIRLLGLPHPVFYVRLVKSLVENWEELEPYLNGGNSKIRPEWHPLDGRYIIMNYDAGQEKYLENTRLAQNCRYKVTADISNFFPSIYSHSIDWALRTIKVAKNDRRSKQWQANLDKCVQDCSYGETSGVPVGPATSNIISEIVIQRVDQEMNELGFHEFIRYVDDYTAYFETLERAESFIQSLDRSLANYRLQLNSRKTQIQDLSVGFGEPWLIDLNLRRPKGRSARKLTQYLQYCELVAQTYPNASVLTYGVKVVLGRQKCPSLHEEIGAGKGAKHNRDIPVMYELMRLSFFHPHLTPHLAALLRYCEPILADAERAAVRIKLTELLAQAARRGETDSCLWLMYCLVSIMQDELSEALILDLVLLNDDLINLSLLLLVPESRDLVRMHVEDMSKASELSLLEHWLIRYESFRMGLLRESSIHEELEKPWFDIAIKSSLKFAAF